MSKTYDLHCPKHGHIHMEVEKPPTKFHVASFCPFCSSNLMKPGKDSEKKWQPNYIAEGVNA